MPRSPVTHYVSFSTEGRLFSMFGCVPKIPAYEFASLQKFTNNFKFLMFVIMMVKMQGEILRLGP